MKIIGSGHIPLWFGREYSDIYLDICFLHRRDTESKVLKWHIDGFTDSRLINKY